MQYTTNDMDMLDAICQVYYEQTSGAVEMVLEANPGLADRDVILPAGVVIVLPALPEPQVSAVRLWD